MGKTDEWAVGKVRRTLVPRLPLRLTNALRDLKENMASGGWLEVEDEGENGRENEGEVER